MTDDEGEPVSIPAAREPPPRELTRRSRLVRRLVAPNPSPFTFNGACTYIVGRGAVAIVDPGPDDDSHHEAILAAVDGEKVETILVTHTHRDHSPGALRDGSRRPVSTSTGHSGSRRWARSGREGGPPHFRLLQSFA
jgi:glyoxylase-like metal-dependent hydrolase (beta-lactamase superfamily II)